MNQAFRIIWSHTRNAFVVASEHACARGKRSSSRLLLAAGASLLVGATPALAGSGSCSSSSTTISGPAAGCVLNTGDNLTVTSSGAIGLYGESAVTSFSGFGTITNAGQLYSYGSTTAITLYSGEGNTSGTAIINQAGGLIEGSAHGINIYGQLGYALTLGSISNAGTIESTDYNSRALNIEDAEVGSIHNQGTGIIHGAGIAIMLENTDITGDFLNDGQITSDSSLSVILTQDGGSLAGDFDNQGTISNGGSASDSSAIRLNGYAIGGSLINGENGVIEGSEGALELSDTTITGDINNAGQMTGRGGFAAMLNNSQVSNIVNSGTITGGYYGLVMFGSDADSIVNSGTIEGGTFGLYLLNDSVIGSLTNSGTIKGGVFSLLNLETLNTLDIEGNGTAHFLGDVYSPSTDVSVKSGAVFSNDNAFVVQRFTVENAATLNMSAGTTASGDLLDGVTVSEGFHNLGTVSLAAGVTGAIHGDYTQAASGTLKIGVTSDSSYGKLVVDGSATLASNAKIAVDVSPSNYSFSAKSLQDVLSASSLNSDGTFKVSDNSTLFDFGAVKDGNTVDLTLSAATNPEEPGKPSGTGLVEEIVTSLGNSPAVGAAQVLDQVIGSDPNGELSGHFVGLTTEQQVSDAVTQTLPTVAGNTNNATSSTLAGINRVVQARQGENSGLSSGDAPLAEDNLWIKTFGSWAEQDERSGISGYDADTQGLAIGADAAVSEATRLGLAFAYAQTNLDNDSHVAPQDAQIDTFLLIGYGSYALAADTELNFQLDAGKNQTEGKRHMPFADATAKSDYDSYSAHAGLGIGHSLRLSEQLTFVPSARVDYTWIDSESYKEQGAGALNLEVDDNDSEELLFSVDGKLDYKLGDATVLSANLGAGYDAINEESSITSVYAGAPGAAFSTPGMDMEPWLARAGLGLTHTLAGGTEVSLRYDAEARSDFTNQGAALKARWAF